MILEISCEVRNREHRGRRVSWTASAESTADVPKLIAAKYPGVWCVRAETRIISDGKPGDITIVPLKRGRPKRG